MQDLKFGDIVVYTGSSALGQYTDLIDSKNYQELYLILDSETSMDSLGQEDSIKWLSNAIETDYTIYSKGSDQWREYYVAMWEELVNWKKQTVDAVIKAEKCLQSLAPE